MRFDLVVNAMYKSAVMTGKIIVNNPNIWRPLVSIDDVVTAYTRALECNESITGVFNISHSNYTIGRLGEDIQRKMNDLSSIPYVNLEINHTVDYRNYKVSTEKAKEVLDFIPRVTPEQAVETISKYMK